MLVLSQPLKTKLPNRFYLQLLRNILLNTWISRNLEQNCPFLRKIQNFIKSERFDWFFSNSIPNVLEHWSLDKELFSSIATFVTVTAVTVNFRKIDVVIKSHSMNQFQRKWYKKSGRVYFRCTQNFTSFSQLILVIEKLQFFELLTFKGLET